MARARVGKDHRLFFVSQEKCGLFSLASTIYEAGEEAAFSEEAFPNRFGSPRDRSEDRVVSIPSRILEA